MAHGYNRGCSLGHHTPRRALSSYVSLGARIVAAEFDERTGAVREVVEARKARGNQARAARNTGKAKIKESQS